MKTRVELSYDQECPNVQEARNALLHAFTEAGLSPTWTEWDNRAPEAPSHARSYGSPTILVEGEDVAGVLPSNDPDCCRVYDDGTERSIRGVPPIDAIAEALKAHARQEGGPAAGKSSDDRWSKPLVVVPGVGAALLPVGVCPACWPAYAGLLSSLGLGFLLETTYLLPLMGAFFLIALASLAYRARERRGYGPLGLGCIATTLALLGKFATASDLVLYLGLALLVGASLWHAWPQRAATGTCPKCASQEPVSQEHAH